MPNRELVCKNEGCPAYRPVASMTADEVLHCECGRRLEIVIYGLTPVWVGPITAKYLDRSKEGGHKKDGAHWVWEKETKPGKGATPTLITTFSEQKEYCKRNGLALPSECGNSYAVAEDGKSLKNPYGEKGVEV